MKPKLLSSGNPQIAKGDGDAPEQASIGFHVHENEPLDEQLVASWIRQSSKLPGDPLF